MGSDRNTTNGVKAHDPHGPSVWHAVQFIGCVAGIYLAYLTQGRVSEELANHRYGSDQTRFPHLESTIGFQCIACFVWAVFLWLLMDSRSGRQFPPIRRYAIVGITNVIGPSCGMVALKNISYPAQVCHSCRALNWRQRYCICTPWLHRGLGGAHNMSAPDHALS
jgi:UAA transporter family